MIDLTVEARQALEGFFEDKEKSPVRIYLGGGCGGPRLTLALDDPSDEDSVFEEGGLTFCVDKELLAQIEGVKLFMTEEGFAVEPMKPLNFMGGSSGSCGGGCGGGGHGGGCCGGGGEGHGHEHGGNSGGCCH